MIGGAIPKTKWRYIVVENVKDQHGWQRCNMVFANNVMIKDLLN